MYAKDRKQIEYALRSDEGERNERGANIIKVIAGCRLDVARMLIRDAGGLFGVFGFDVAALEAHGLSPIGAARLHAAQLLAREYRTFHHSSRSPLASAEDVWQLANVWAWHEDGQEVFRVLSLDVRTALIGVDVVAIGSVDRVEVLPRDVVRAVLRRNAVGFVLVHNHPAGDPKPSDNDVALTKRMLRVSEVVGIPMIDHIVVASRGFRSIAELKLVEGLGEGVNVD